MGNKFTKTVYFSSKYRSITNRLFEIVKLFIQIKIHFVYLRLELIGLSHYKRTFDQSSFKFISIFFNLNFKFFFLG